MKTDDSDPFTALTEALEHSAAAGQPDPEVLSALLSHARSQPLADYPATARRLRYAAWRVGLKATAPVAGLVAADPGMAALLLHSPNGWHRDAALLRLPTPRTAFDFAALLDRLDDWVPELRRLAETLFQRQALVIPPGIVAEVALVRLSRIEGARRISTVGHRLWSGLLARTDVRDALIQRLRDDRGRPVRLLFLRLLETPGYDAALPVLAREAAHPSIRAASLWWQMEGQVSYAGAGTAFVPGVGWRPRQGRRPLAITPDRAALMHHAARDRSSQVRKVAAEMLRRFAATDPEGAQALARKLARDRNTGVRQRADWFLTPR
ncbi:MAG: hypothetical protein KDK12_06985 [Rhodobacteraceae bacterium]|nr:hypothetical protein [Paracoccaceae bacterium]